MPQMTGLIDIFDLSVRQRSAAVRAPVDDAAAFVNQALLIKGNKRFSNCMGAAFVHCKTRPIPITGTPELLLLFDNAIAEAVFPRPDTFKEFIPA